MTGNTNIHIALEILHSLFGAELMDFSFWNIDNGMILYARQHPESYALSLVRKILWSCIGIWVAVVMSGLVWTQIINNSGK